MNRFITLSSIALSIALCLSGSKSTAQVAVPQDVQALLPAGTLVVDIMQPYTPARLAQLSKKVEVVARAHPELIRELIAKEKPGQRLPYDARLGITRAEYDEMLTLKPYLESSGKTKITISARGPLRILDGGQALPALTGLEIDFKRGTAKSGKGTVRAFKTIHASSGTIMGPWDGVAWTYDEQGQVGRFPGQLSKGTVIGIGFGKLKESGLGMLYYRVEEIVNRESRDVVFIVVEYPLPRPKR